MRRLAIIILAVFIAPGLMAQATDPINAPASIANGNPDAGTTSHGDSDYSILPSDRTIVLGAKLTAPRTWRLPCASASNAGQSIQIIDPHALANSGRATKSSRKNFYVIVAAGAGCSDNINGASANTVRLDSPGGRVVATTEHAHNWTVAVVKLPAVSKDFVSDYLGEPATAIGTSDCSVNNSGSPAFVTCGSETFSASDVGHVFVAQGIGPKGAALGAGDGSPFVTTISSLKTGGGANLADIPPQSSTGVVNVIDELPVISGGRGYTFGSIQTLSDTAGIANAKAKGTPVLMKIVFARVNTVGSGGIGTSVNLQLNPSSSPNALAGKQQTLTAPLSSGHLVSGGSLTVNNDGSQYRMLPGYSFANTAGQGEWYLNIPVLDTANHLTGATIDIQFAVVSEALTTPSNYYQTGLSCNTSPYDSPTSTDHGQSLVLKCNTHEPLVSWGKDNHNAITSMNDDLNSLILAKTPACVNISGRFLTTPLDLKNDFGHVINGPACLKGDAQILSGFYMVPAPSSSSVVGSHPVDQVVIPILNANGNGSTTWGQSQVTDPDHYVKGGVYIKDLAFWGDQTSPGVQNAIKFYGFNQWATVENVSGFSIRGCLICVGTDVSVAVPHDNPNGLIAESVFYDIRSEYTGDKYSGTPAFGLDGISDSSDIKSNSANNDLILRYRTWRDLGLPLAIRPCTGHATNDLGTGAHQLTIEALKIEESDMEFSFNATDGVQVGATSAECGAQLWGAADGTVFQQASGGSESGVHGLTFVAPNIVNMAVGNAAMHFKGLRGDGKADIDNVRILGSGISGGNGLGLVFDKSDANNYVDIVTNNTADYNLVYNGVSGALEYNGHASSPTVSNPSNLAVMTTLRSALNSATIFSGFGTNPSITPTGSAEFQIAVGTSPVSSGIITLPAAPTGWDCKVTNISSFNANQFLTKQTGGTLTTVTLTNFDSTLAAHAWNASDLLNVTCNLF